MSWVEGTLGLHLDPPRVHGGLDLGELELVGVPGDQVIDFSVNSNPYGPAPRVLSAIRMAPVDRYPDTNARVLKERLSKLWGIPSSCLCIGNGAADLLWSLASTASPGAAVLIVEPTFSEFRIACHHLGLRVNEWRAKSGEGFALDLAAIGNAAAAVDAELLYLCNPNSPTGSYVDLDQVVALARALPDLTIILDQAFLSLSVHYRDDRLDLPENLLVVRSFTKEHAIAGLRLGCLIGPPVKVAAVEGRRPYWSINSLAQAAGLAACDETDFVAESRSRMLADKEYLVAGLKGLGLEPLPSSTVFFLLKIFDGDNLRLRLLRREILVRSCSSYGLPHYLRLCARPRKDADHLLRVLREELR